MFFSSLQNFQHLLNSTLPHQLHTHLSEGWCQKLAKEKEAQSWEHGHGSRPFPRLEEDEWIPPVPINTLSPHGRSAPECLFLLIPDKPEPPAQRGEGWMDRVKKERRERGGSGQEPGADRVGGMEEAKKPWEANRQSETWDFFGLVVEVIGEECVCVCV